MAKHQTLRKKGTGKGIYSDMVAEMTAAETKAMQEGGLTHAHLINGAEQ